MGARLCILQMRTFGDQKLSDLLKAHGSQVLSQGQSQCWGLVLQCFSLSLPLTSGPCSPPES